MDAFIKDWYTISYSILLGLAGIFFTLFTVIYALIDSKKNSMSYLESKKKRGNATERQKSDLKYWTDYKSSLCTLNIHVLILFVISVVLCLLFVTFCIKEVHSQWLTWILMISEGLMLVYIIYVFVRFVISYFKNIKD